MGGTRLEPGEVFADKYRIDGVLGRGGMGVVYAATNLAVGRRVAIKVMETGQTDPETREALLHRFHLEAQAAAVIEHPGIVDVLDMGETAEGSPYIVMEFLEGATLKAVLRQLSVMSPGQAATVMVPVLEALAAAHAAGVVHRDIKPANIFLCTRPKHAIKVLDFGISRFGTGSGVTQTGVSMGTPQYMPPEQARGERGVGPESDLYSVGAVLYHLLTGRAPFEAENDMALLARVLTEAPRPLLELRPDLPVALGKLVDGLLQKEQARREADALEVRRLLLAIAPVADEGAVWAAAKSAVRQELSRGPGSSKRSAPGVLAMPGRTPSKPATLVARPTPVPGAVSPTGPLRPSETKVAPASNRGAAIALVALAVLGGGALAAWVLTSSGPKVTQPPTEIKPAVVKGPDGPPPSDAKPPGVKPPDDPKVDPPPVEAVEVVVTAEPSQARLEVDGTTCDNPCTLTRPSGSRAELKVSADHFVDGQFELLFDKPHERRVALSPAEESLPTTHKKGPKKRPLSVDETNPYR